jgi:hypothetical protein
MASMHKGTASVHPWHFDYKRDKNSDPYWSIASQQGNHGNIEFEDKTRVKPDLTRRNSDINNYTNMHILLKNMSTVNIDIKNDLNKKYSVDVIELCLKIYGQTKGCRKDIRKAFRDSQINGLKGKIPDQIFIQILKSRGVSYMHISVLEYLYPHIC